MYMVFEDNINSGPSKLILQVYTEEIAKFATGNMNVCEYLRDNRLLNNLLIYIDVSPDNNKTVEAYKRCTKWLLENNAVNSYVIPIPCIEYYIIDAFMPHELPEVQVVLKTMSYNKCTTNCRGKELSLINYENYAKSVLEQYKPCFRKKEIFYKYDCLCTRSKEDCTAISLKDKGRSLVLKLPMFSMIGDLNRDEIITVDKQTTVDRMIEFYDYRAKNMIEAGIIKTYIPLV